MSFRLVYVILFFPLAAAAQGDLLTLTQGPTSGGKVTLNLSLTSSAGQEPAALQWTFSYSPADFTAIQVTAGPAAVGAAKSVSCAGTATAYKCLAAGVNASAIADGVLAIVSLTISATTTNTTSSIQLLNPMAASPAGNEIPIGGSGVSATLTGVSVSSASVWFTYTMSGTVPASQSIQISNAGGGSLNWTATSTAPWLKLMPASGSTPSTIAVSVEPAGLAASAYTDTIQISAQGGGRTSVNVTLTVNTAATFVPIVPCRVADTRNPHGAFGGPAITGGSSRDFAIPRSACNIPPSAIAYSLNVAVVPAHSLGYLTVWPAGETRPDVATLTSLDGRIRSNAAMVPAGTAGAISVFATDSADVVLDINGYFVGAGNTSGLAFYPLKPCRIADTRNAAGAFGGPALAAHSARSFPIKESDCAVPAAAEAYGLNFTALPRGPLGYLTAWPAGQPQPTVASLNAVTGTITANAVTVPAGANGDVSVYSTNDADLLIDTNGYFAPAQAGGLSFYSLAPCRVLDTRPSGGSPFRAQLNVAVGGNCGVPATARAYVLNATVVPAGVLNFLTLWPQGTAQPLVSTLNAVDGAITSNLAIVPVTNGAIEAFASDQTHLILDIFGYFAP